MYCFRGIVKKNYRFWKIAQIREGGARRKMPNKENSVRGNSLRKQKGRERENFTALKKIRKRCENTKAIYTSRASIMKIGRWVIA